MADKIICEGRKLMIPGKDNKEDRINFVKFWADYVREHDDKDWSKQQNILIDGQINMANRFYRKLAESEEGRMKIRELRKK